MGTEVVSLHIRLADGREMRLSGREAWALHALKKAGKVGITPRDCPGPRWSHYVMRLREHGIEIETITERHDGAYPGQHGRYVLGTSIELVSVGYAKQLAKKPSAIGPADRASPS